MKFTGWQVVSIVLIVMVCCTGPFWVQASNLEDGSELDATTIGASLSGSVLGVASLLKLFLGHNNGG